ncbi:c-type cytochrome [Alcanivorax sp. JB21]|uniref:c-type cytochrome n=1 Tax=Alcanivorax limicola TaxID=2874102 RepID=UPI001CBE8FF5|nr:c-type cytochrome [Alcanivorax limicola]MBZ2188697.1 c-type cytochrome [Alcanivorax limicola]
MNKFVVISLAVLATLLAGVTHGARSTQEISPHGLGDRSVFSERAIEERLRPVGRVCVEGQDCGTAAEATEVASGPRSGEAVYNTACAACHTSGAAGAPVKGDQSAWAPRISKGMDTLAQHTIDGFGAMPAMGMCMDCSEDEVRAAVKYLVDASR